jgi:hypothetical protein
MQGQRTNVISRFFGPAHYGQGIDFPGESRTTQRPNEDNNQRGAVATGNFFY